MINLPDNIPLLTQPLLAPSTPRIPFPADVFTVAAAAAVAAAVAAADMFNWPRYEDPAPGTVTVNNKH